MILYLVEIDAPSPVQRAQQGKICFPKGTRTTPIPPIQKMRFLDVDCGSQHHGACLARGIGDLHRHHIMNIYEFINLICNMYV